MTHPLDIAFDTALNDGVRDEYSPVVIPESVEEQNLALITQLALRAYKEQMEDIVHIEPRNRSKHLEVAERFLGQAKDAIDKREKLALQREKQAAANPRAATPTAEQPVAGAPVSRKELAERMQLVRSK